MTFGQNLENGKIIYIWTQRIIRKCHIQQIFLSPVIVRFTDSFINLLYLSLNERFSRLDNLTYWEKILLIGEWVILRIHFLSREIKKKIVHLPIQKIDCEMISSLIPLLIPSLILSLDDQHRISIFRFINDVTITKKNTRNQDKKKNRAQHGTS